MFVAWESRSCAGLDANWDSVDPSTTGGMTLVSSKSQGERIIFSRQAGPEEKKAPYVKQAVDMRNLVGSSVLLLQVSQSPELDCYDGYY